MSISHLTKIAHTLRCGFRLRCCRCGKGRLLRGYLRVQPRCPACNEQYSQYRVDDAPAYFTIILVGHLVIPCILLIERLDQPPSLLFQMALWLPVTAGLTALLLPRVKGMVLAIHWLLGISDQPDAGPPPANGPQGY